MNSFEKCVIAESKPDTNIKGIITNKIILFLPEMADKLCIPFPDLACIDAF
ncbi:MAG: hypothetical protein AAE985_04455 [Thermoplasmataceae archaeon]|jgi:hypothetical protein